MRTPHIVPLSKPAVNLLRTLRLVTGHGPMLFSGLDPAGRQRAPQHPGVRIAQLCMAGRHLGHAGAIAAQSSERDWSKLLIWLDNQAISRGDFCAVEGLPEACFSGFTARFRHRGEARFSTCNALSVRSQRAGSRTGCVNPHGVASPFEGSEPESFSDFDRGNFSAGNGSDFIDRRRGLIARAAFRRAQPA